MESATFDLYRDIAERTDGDVYLGVVGPVRTGKSTFITRLMELLVMPKIPEGARKERIADELPQSGSGRTIMTTQPQFVPSEAVTVSLSDNAPVRVRLVDSVGYMVRGALGSVDKTGSRMVHTPWYDHDIPFEQAAEVGTRKVMTDHGMQLNEIVPAELARMREAVKPVTEKYAAQLDPELVKAFNAELEKTKNLK